MKRKLNDRLVKSLKPAKAGTRYEVQDTTLPGFMVRVTDTGQCSYVLRTRFPGSPNANRRAIGDVGAMALTDARERAREWLALIAKGVDPAVEAERARQAAMRKQKNTFASVAEDFIEKKLPGERKGKEVAQDIRREFIPLWGRRPISEVSRQEIRAAIEAKAQTAPAQARNLLVEIKRLFAWAVDQDRYGLEASPAELLKASKIVGERISGDRVLSDAEIFALWRTAGRLPYPFGAVYRLLILTALRLNEVADTSWPEFDIAKRHWVIPATRMKGRNSKAKAHVVPLTNDILKIIEALPRFKFGAFLFSTTFGAKPVWVGDKIKKQVDARMLRTLRALARRRGDDPAKVKLPHWTNHDIRRTMRTKLSELRVQEEVSEAVLAHVKQGIKGTYNQYQYFDEKRAALDLWAARLRDIIEPPAANVVAFARG
jgi:integrase